MAAQAQHRHKKSEQKYNFHNDDSLHDDTTREALPWYANIGGDAWAIIKNIPVIRNQGSQQGAKHIAASLDLEDPLNKYISKGLVSKLWGSIPHPPTSCLGDEYKYRTPDGSNNSVLYPELGKAGAPYARTVPGKRPLHGARPDPGDLFDLLMARDDEGNESTSGISMMLLYHAILIIHDIFKTDDDNPNISANSTYLDLATLYGSDLETQKAVRLMKDGLLKPDTFAETRLLHQPPGVCIYIIMYNRFHNYVAKQLKELNEHERFSLPPGCQDTAAARADPRWTQAFEAQDEHLFQTARLVTCGMYINIAIHDYLKCLMGMHEIDSPWTLDPRTPFPEKNNKKGLGRGEGNMVSCEFNLLYRFHSPLSRRDTQWTEELFTTFIKMQGYIDDSDSPEAREAIKAGKKFSSQQVKNGELPLKVFQMWIESRKQQKRDKTAAAGPSKDQPFFPAGLDVVGGLNKNRMYRFSRNADGYFDTAQLAAEMCRVIEDPICSFGAQQVPKVFRAIEIMGILQARKWEVATLNEFREFFGISRFKTFEEVNSDPVIQEHLRNLYEDPDLIELYPGLFLEGKGRVLDPGTQCPGGQPSALWRGVFSDAVTLVRSDRFYTLDWNVGSLTAWGMKEVTSESKINKGSVMHRLFQRAFPGCFEYNSVHMWQPFYTPTKNVELAAKQGYLRFLNLQGLEDKSRNEYSCKYFAQALSKWQEDIKANLVRRKLHDKRSLADKQEFAEPRWRGDERVTIKQGPPKITSHATISEILSGQNSLDWATPSILTSSDIPKGPLRQMLIKSWGKLPQTMEIVGKSLSKDWEQIFMDYFVGVAQDIRLREQRPMQKRHIDRDGNRINVQTYQLDVVKDMAIPVITRFVADLIGFWEQVKTVEFHNRKYEENDIYFHIENCQNFETHDSDPTTTWRRRMAYQESIKVLKQLAEDGVHRSQHGWLEDVLHSRSYGTENDGEAVHSLRRVGVTLIQALLKKLSTEEVAAFMLCTALDAAQQFVTTFSEALAWCMKPENASIWQSFHDLAWQDTSADLDDDFIYTSTGKNDQSVSAQLKAYVLEIVRLSSPHDIARVYQPVDSNVDQTSIVTEPLSKNLETLSTPVARGDTVVLDLVSLCHSFRTNNSTNSVQRSACSDPASGYESPDRFTLRPIEHYIEYGSSARLSKRATVIALAATLKHCAHLSSLRVAHGAEGSLKRVMTPEGRVTYTSPQWDRLLSSPTTWNLRFDGVGQEIHITNLARAENHGQSVVNHQYSQVKNVARDNKAVSVVKAQVSSDEADIKDRIEQAVKHAVAEGLAKERSNMTTVQATKVAPVVVLTEVAAEEA